MPRICAIAAVESKREDQVGEVRSGAGRADLGVVKLFRERTGVVAKSALVLPPRSAPRSLVRQSFVCKL